MFISPTIIQHGIIALENEIMRLEMVNENCGDEWPSDFDPNDRWIYDQLLQEFRKYKASGYEEHSLHGKPFRFFVALIPSYINSNMDKLSQASYLELHHLYSEI